jgi:hypothetical protein
VRVEIDEMSHDARRKDNGALRRPKELCFRGGEGGGRKSGEMAGEMGGTLTGADPADRSVL